MIAGLGIGKERREEQESAVVVLVRSFEGFCERRILRRSSDFLRERERENEREIF